MAGFFGDDDDAAAAAADVGGAVWVWTCTSMFGT
jgi:hypothetical protein